MGSIVESAAVFLDRDGTLIRDVGYLRRIEQIELLPRVPEAIQLLSRKGLKVVLITNQSGVARGLINEGELGNIHEQLRRALEAQDARLDGIYYCPHHPTVGEDAYRMVCDCRKPNTALVRRAASDLALDPTRSYVVGDQMTDMVLASRIGAQGIWIHDGVSSAENPLPYHIVSNLWQAAHWIINRLEASGKS